MGRWKVTCGVVLAAAVALSVAPAASAGTFGPPFDVSSLDDGKVFLPRVGIADSGNATLAWAAGDGVDFSAAVRRVGLDGSPLGPLRVLGNKIDAADLATNGTGDAIVAWREPLNNNKELQFARFGPGPLPPPVTGDLAETGDDPVVAMNDAGLAAAAWRIGMGAQARRILPDGTTSTVYDLDAGNAVSAPLGVVVDRNGVSTIVWTESIGPDLVVRAQRIDADGDLQPTVYEISDPDKFSANPVVGVDATGRVTIVWAEGPPPLTVKSRQLTSDGSLTDIQTLSEGDVALPAMLDVNSAGVGTAVWSTNLLGVKARRIESDGEPGPTILDVGTHAGPSPTTSVGVDDAGTATIVWAGSGDGGSVVVKAREIKPNGTLDPSTQDISEFDPGPFPVIPWVAVNPRGDAIAAWARDEIAQAATAPAAGTLEIVKELDPADDPGRFDLRIDGAVEAADAGNGTSTGAITVGAGEHTVSETAGTGTNLSDYTSAIACSDGTAGEGPGPLTVEVANDEDVTCTITNARIPPTPPSPPPPPPPPTPPTPSAPQQAALTPLTPGPQPTPAPARPASTRCTLVSSNIPVSARGIATLPVRCTQQSANTAGRSRARGPVSRGSITLRARVLRAQRRTPAFTGATRLQVIGSTRFAIPTGRTRAVRVRLTTRARRALRQGRLRTERATVRARPGPTSTRRIKLVRRR